MRVDGVPNKYEIFQDFYLIANGEPISYTEALRLFYQMDDEQKTRFEKYYKDETGYEIISASGYDIPGDVELTRNPSNPDELLVVGTKTVKKKEKQPDGTIKYVDKTYNIYTSNLAAINKLNLEMQYSIEAYAKKSGKILDPVWSGYSAQEIIQMQQNGVDIPQDIIDIANTIMQSQGSNLENSAEVDEGDSETVTEKTPYLDLIPKVKNKIEKCNENNEKLSAELDKLLPETKNEQQNFQDKIKDQKKALEEYEKQLKEWRALQDKVNNGEVLSDTEASRYAELTGMLEDKKGQNSDEMIFDKNEIAKSLNQINILAVLGEDLGDETIYLGDMLADYTSQSNYKRTYQTVSQKLGFIGSILSMAEGKTLAKEANKTGNDTQEYSGETVDSVKSIASTIGVENSVLSATELQSTQTAEAPEQAGPEDEQPVNPANSEENQDETAAAKENDTEEDDFILNDESVQQLTEEAGVINSDLQRQIQQALASISTAQSHKDFAQTAEKKADELIKAYNKEEEARQQRIKELEDENKNAKKDLESLTGKSSEEIDSEISSSNPEDEKIDEATRSKITEKKKVISDNQIEIQAINEETEAAKKEFQIQTAKEKSTLDKSIPEEITALDENNEYKNSLIPEYSAQLDFTNNSGITLSRIGAFFVEMALKQFILSGRSRWLYAKGIQSVETGKQAQREAAKPYKNQAEKSTNEAFTNISDALSSLNSVDTKIVAITGEDSALSTASSENTNSAENNSGTQQPQQNSQDTAKAQASASQAQATPKTANDAQPAGVQTGAAASVENANNPINSQQAKEGSTKQTNPTNSTPENEIDGAVEEAAQPNTALSSTSSKSDDPKQQAEEEAEKADEKTADKSQKEVDTIDASANKDAKDSKDIKKETEKTKKELEKDAKKLQKQIQQEQKEAEQLTKESEEAAKKQEEMLAEYQALVTENETLAAEDASKKQQNSQPQNNNSQGGQLGSSSFSIANQGDNSDRINSNNERLNALSALFQISGNTIVRNNTKLVNIEKSVTKKQKTFEKTNKAITKKVKQEQKDEKEKQEKLQKQLGAVGIAENVFSITTSTGVIMNKIGTGMIASGTAMLSNPFTAAAGAALISSGTPIQTTGITLTTVGTYGTVACGVTKAAINIANGNLAAGLMSLGQTALSAVTTMSGTQGAVSSTLTAVSAGMNIVSSGASMVNNVRAVQGKEASGVFSKISTIAGAASSLTTSASTIADLGNTGASAFGKSMQIAGVAGSALSTTSQIMTEFGAEGNVANILGMVGGAISTISAVGQLAAKKADNNAENEKEDKTEDKKETDKKDSTEKTSKEERREQKAQEKEELKEAKAARKAQKEASKGLDKELKENMRENGASKEYANMDDATLDTELAAAQQAGNNDQIAKLSAEKQQRADYKDKMAKIEASSERKQKNLSNIISAVSGAANTGTQLLSMNQNKPQSQKKKAAPPGRLTERAKKIIAKHKMRVASLSAMA